MRWSIWHAGIRYTGERRWSFGKACGVGCYTRFEKVFPSDDELKKQPQVWRQKGKLYVLKGHLAFREFQQRRQKIAKGLPAKFEIYWTNGENYALALDLNSRFAVDFQGIRQAKNSIDANLRLWMEQKCAWCAIEFRRSTRKVQSSKLSWPTALSGKQIKKIFSP